jgi:hypothetical protein
MLYHSGPTVGTQVLGGHNLLVHMAYSHHILRNALAEKGDTQQEQCTDSTVYIDCSEEEWQDKEALRA